GEAFAHGLGRGCYGVRRGDGRRLRFAFRRGGLRRGSNRCCRGGRRRGRGRNLVRRNRRVVFRYLRRRSNDRFFGVGDGFLRGRIGLRRCFFARVLRGSRWRLGFPLWAAQLIDELAVIDRR